MAKKRHEKGVTWRAILVGLLLIPPVAYWVMLVERIWHTGHPSCISLPWGVMFPLMAVILVNFGVKVLLPRLALT